MASVDRLQAGDDPGVFTVSISQATTATFTDLYFKTAFLFFIQVGSKRVLCPVNGELVGQAGDMIVFPMGSMVTLENRPVLTAHYRATGVCFSQRLIHDVFAQEPLLSASTGIQVVQDRAAPQILHTVQTTLSDSDLPDAIRQHRLLEPLIWLKSRGVYLASYAEETPLSQVRQLIETDLSHPWRSYEVAEHFAMSEATLRRWLAKSGQGFAKILQNTRLEHGLSLLQSTRLPITDIALDCGFKTPSHFSESFKKRFGIQPSAIRQRED